MTASRLDFNNTGLVLFLWDKDLLKYLCVYPIKMTYLASQHEKKRVLAFNSIFLSFCWLRINHENWGLTEKISIRGTPNSLRDSNSVLQCILGQGINCRVLIKSKWHTLSRPTKITTRNFASTKSHINIKCYIINVQQYSLNSTYQHKLAFVLLNFLGTPPPNE